MAPVCCPWCMHRVTCASHGRSRQAWLCVQVLAVTSHAARVADVGPSFVSSAQSCGSLLPNSLRHSCPDTHFTRRSPQFIACLCHNVISQVACHAAALLCAPAMARHVVVVSWVVGRGGPGGWTARPHFVVYQVCERRAMRPYLSGVSDC